MRYVLDTNIVSDLLKRYPQVTDQIERHLSNDELLYLCQPVHYETLRGLIRKGATSQIQRLENNLRPVFEWVALTDDDWLQAARYWALATSRGRQLSDVDLLIAAIATRLDAVIVSSDADFDALPVKRQNWRLTPSSGS